MIRVVNATMVALAIALAVGAAFAAPARAAAHPTAMHLEGAFGDRNGRASARVDAYPDEPPLAYSVPGSFAIAALELSG